MSKLIPETNDRMKTQRDAAKEMEQPAEPKTPWETPKMEDVSEQVMAQPYIRFT